MTTKNQPRATGEAAQVSPIPGPFRADKNTVKAVSHGSWFTVVRCDNPRFTPEAKARMAAHVSHCLNSHAALVAALEFFENYCDKANLLSPDVLALVPELEHMANMARSALASAKL